VMLPRSPGPSPTMRISACGIGVAAMSNAVSSRQSSVVGATVLRSISVASLRVGIIRNAASIFWGGIADVRDERCDLRIRYGVRALHPHRQHGKVMADRDCLPQFAIGRRKEESPCRNGIFTM